MSTTIYAAVLVCGIATMGAASVAIRALLGLAAVFTGV
jgi:hypothetical protein